MGTKLSYNFYLILLKNFRTIFQHLKIRYNGDRDGADDLAESDKLCGDKVVLNYFLNISDGIGYNDCYDVTMMVLMTK